MVTAGSITNVIEFFSKRPKTIKTHTHRALCLQIFIFISYYSRLVGFSVLLSSLFPLLLNFRFRSSVAAIHCYSFESFFFFFFNFQRFFACMCVFFYLRSLTFCLLVLPLFFTERCGAYIRVILLARSLLLLFFLIISHCFCRVVTCYHGSTTMVWHIAHDTQEERTRRGPHVWICLIAYMFMLNLIDFSFAYAVVFVAVVVFCFMPLLSVAYYRHTLAHSAPSSSSQFAHEPKYPLASVRACVCSWLLCCSAL